MHDLIIKSFIYIKPDKFLTYSYIQMPTVCSKRSLASVLKWNETEALARSCAIYSAEVRQAVRFLHSLGTIQHFDSEILRSYVVINAQWIIDVMVWYLC